MASSINVDMAILGGGIAGTCLGWYLNRKGAKVALIDNQWEENSSRLPAAIVNPVSIQQPNAAWQAEASYNELLSLINSIQTDHPSIQTDHPFFHQTGIIRPALDDTLFANFCETLKSSEWPDGWFSWLDQQELIESLPQSRNKYGGINLRKGGWINLPEFMESIYIKIRELDIPIVQAENYRIEKSRNSVQIFTNEDHSICCNYLIFATGAHLKRSPLWSILPMHKVKGQSALFKTARPVNFKQPVMALGHIIPQDSHLLYAGGTYEHAYQDVRPDEHGTKKLHTLIKTLLPGISDHIALKDQWAEISLITPNNLPFLGSHPRQQEYYVIAGFGAKGAITTPYAANILANHLIHGEPISDELNTERYWQKLRKLGKI